MELRHLRYFVAVAEELHFGHAASRLNTSQPSLSQQIRDLERELKVDLFLRTKRHVALTPAGRRFLQEARGILSSAERAAGLAREAARGESRKIAIGISPETDWLFLGKVLHLFAEHAPSVDVVFQNLTPEAQVDALRAGHIDVGFVGLPLEAEGMVTETTGRARLMIALPERHPMAHKAELELEELSKEAYVLWPRHLSPGSYDSLLSVFRRAGFGPPIAMAGGLPSTRTVLGMIAAGLTIALVDPALQQIGAAGVVFRPLAGPGVFTETGVIYRRAEVSPILASFLHEVRTTPREHTSPPAVANKKVARKNKKGPRREKRRSPRRRGVRGRSS
jgi:DNA-binding transcriptional LysR family regulator